MRTKTSLHTPLWIAVLAALLLGFSSMAAASGLIDVNTASASELTRLPGIGQSRAEAIVEFRNANGPFRSVDDLVRVPGIGQATLANMRPMVTVGEGEGAPPAAAPAPQAAPAQPAAPAAGESSRPAARGVTELDLSDAPAAPPARGAAPAPQPAPQASPQASSPPPAQAAPQASGNLININTAGASELTRIPGVGAARAQAIIDYRDANGPFANIEDLVRVPGIGPATMTNARPMITVE